MDTVKEILLSTFLHISECTICKRKIEEEKTEKNGLCLECERSRKFKYKIEDLVEYKGEIWTIRGRLVVELQGEDIFVNQYFLQQGEDYKHVFEGKLGEEGLKIKETSCPKCKDVIRYKPGHTTNVTCLKCGHWYLI